MKFVITFLEVSLLKKNVDPFAILAFVLSEQIAQPGIIEKHAPVGIHWLEMVMFLVQNVSVQKLQIVEKFDSFALHVFILLQLWFLKNLNAVLMLIVLLNWLV